MFMQSCYAHIIVVNCNFLIRKGDNPNEIRGHAIFVLPLRNRQQKSALSIGGYIDYRYRRFCKMNLCVECVINL